ncbi:MAG: ribonuclease H-like domain-containing protein [Patescibacteria group bacterium]|nr:ribonuclease H-like domain-containing protein [Patescibacteria group bacterium]
MTRHPVILDLETQKTFREESDPKKLGISVVAIYDYADGRGKTFLENQINQLFPILERCSYIIGYNITSFDIPVLQGYYPGDVANFGQFDIMEDVRQKIGRRIGLNDLAGATLNVKKSGHGLMAIDYFKEGKWEELKKYCIDDVMVTRDLFEYGVQKGHVKYKNERGIVDISVEWSKYKTDSGKNDPMPMTLPF